MLRLLFKLSLFSPLVAGMVWINWTVDPARFFVPSSSVLTTGYEGLIVQDLFAGRPHFLAGEYDQRVVIEELLRNRQSLDVLVLGSSVAKPFHSGLFPNSSFLNAAVTGGDLEEAICAYELAWERGFRPKRVLIQFQGWNRLLGARTDAVEPTWQALLGRALRRLGASSKSLEQAGLPGDRFFPIEKAAEFKLDQEWRELHPYDKLISPRYFQTSIEVLWRTGWPEMNSSERVVPNTYTEGRRPLLYPDGSLQWPESMLSATPDSIRRSQASVLPGLAKLEKSRPDAARCGLFETFVLDTVNSGTQVDLVLTPPISWLSDQIDAQYTGTSKVSPAAETEQYLREFASNHGLKVFGSFDPRKTDLTDSDYVDFQHIRRESIGRLLKPQRDPSGRGAPQK